MYVYQYFSKSDEKSYEKYMFNSFRSINSAKVDSSVIFHKNFTIPPSLFSISRYTQTKKET